MRGAAAAGWGAGADQSFVHDLADGVRAAATLGAAAEAAIDLAGRARRRRIHGPPHLMIAQHVAGTDDHRKTSSHRSVDTAEWHFRYRHHCAKSNKTLFENVLKY
jgi:hypothetical protein